MGKVCQVKFGHTLGIFDVVKDMAEFHPESRPRVGTRDLNLRLLRPLRARNDGQFHLFIRRNILSRSSFE